MRSHLETVDVKTQVLGLRAGVTLDTGFGISGTGSRWWGHPGDCGHVTQSAVSGEKVDSGDCGCVTNTYGLGGVHRGYCRHLTSGIGSGRGVTVETVAM